MPQLLATALLIACAGGLAVAASLVNLRHVRTQQEAMTLLAESERRLATTEIALDIMGKAHTLLEQISESATEQQHRKR